MIIDRKHLLNTFIHSFIQIRSFIFISFFFFCFFGLFVCVIFAVHLFVEHLNMLNVFYNFFERWHIKKNTHFQIEREFSSFLHRLSHALQFLFAKLRLLFVRLLFCLVLSFVLPFHAAAPACQPCYLCLKYS